METNKTSGIEIKNFKVNGTSDNDRFCYMETRA